MNVCALILAGGEGRRMGGQDKGLLHYQNSTFIDHVMQRIAPQVDHIAISANRNLEQYAQRSPHVFADSRQWKGQGPLAALCTAASDFQLTHADWLLIVPCDTLKLPDNLVKIFQAAAKKSPLCSAFYAETPTQAHYSILFLRPQILPSIVDYLKTDHRSIRGWLIQQRAHSVPFHFEEDFINFNALEDLES